MISAVRTIPVVAHDAGSGMPRFAALTAAAGKITRHSPAAVVAPSSCEMNYWTWHWAYWVAPIIGAVLAAQVYDRILLPRDEHIEVKG